MKLDNFLQKLISWLFAGMFFLIPLFFTPLTSELFEFNKIILVYMFATLITGTWTCRMILQRKVIFKRSFLDIPLALFLLSQIISTIFSIDTHTSIFGYYSRFNGGLLSTVSYLLLYFAFVSNCEIKDVYRSLKFSLISAAVVAIYGILEHFGHSFSCVMFGAGFNVDCWVQKVQERVFATLGQPNWLAAYLIVLTPLTWWLVLSSKFKVQSSKLKFKIKSYWPFLIFGLFFSCLIFTQSRSGFLGFILSFAVFWGIIFFIQKSNSKIIIKPFLSLIFAFCTLIFVFGSPFPQINKFLYYKSYVAPTTPPRLAVIGEAGQNPPSSLDGGISESGDIRKIVWKGAIGIFKHYPIFGSGVETFAYSYYNFRPVEHNLVSEWDFLYNKAHNEYLNYLSTTGIFGLGTYILFIGAFIFGNIFQFYSLSFRPLRLRSGQASRRNPFLSFCAGKGSLDPSTSLRAGPARDDNNNILTFALFSGWLSLLVTNFFGFSVVITSLYFFLIPAFCVILSRSLNPANPILTSHPRHTSHLSPPPLLLIPVLFTFYILHFTLNLWRADFFYNRGEKLAKQNLFSDAYDQYFKSYQLFKTEPLFLNELSSVTANLALLTQKDQASASAELSDLAIAYSDQAIKISPVNLNILKNRMKVFYTLSTLKPEYLLEAIKTLESAIKLSPTDPKLVYNLGLLNGKAGNAKLAIELIEKSVELKPNYVDARNALSIFYEDLGEKQKALEQLEILIKLAPENKEDFEKRIDMLK